MKISDVTEVDLHDAIIENLSVSFADRSVDIRVKYYESDDAKERSDAIITFFSVSTISGLLDFDALSDNSRAGNINYWKPSQKGGTTYLYFSDGCLSLTAESVELDKI